MNSDKNVEKAFELAEQFDFIKLSCIDKKYILSVMDEDEYNDIRNTIKGLPNCFKDEIEPNQNIPQLAAVKKKSKLMGILYYKIPLYKVAISVIVAFFILKVTTGNEALDKNNKSDFVVLQTIGESNEHQSGVVEEVMSHTKNNSLANDSVTRNILAIINL